MQQLIERLNAILDEAGEQGAEIRKQLPQAQSLEPFGWTTDVIAHLFGKGMITLEDYHQLRSEYFERNAMLHLFDMNADFGRWAERHVVDVSENVKRGSKKYDPNYDREYDLWLDGAKIEVKGSRVVNGKYNGLLRERALPFGTDEYFVMNFQHLKPQFCDVFVWVAVWRDRITYWVLASHEVRNNRQFAFQGRGQHEGQVRVRSTNIHEFERYFLPDSLQLELKIREAYKRELEYRERRKGCDLPECVTKKLVFRQKSSVSYQRL